MFRLKWSFLDFYLVQFVGMDMRQLLEIDLLKISHD